MISQPFSSQLPMVLASPVLQAIESGQYPDYLLRVYQHQATTSGATALVHVVEVDGIDIQSGRLSSIPIQWWRVEPANALPIDAPDMSPFNSAGERGEPLYPTPLIKFFLDWPKVLSMESVGPMMRRCVIFTLKQVDDTLEVVDETLLWLANYPDQVMVGGVR
jgi:hypothetical protein